MDMIQTLTVMVWWAVAYCVSILGVVVLVVYYDEWKRTGDIKWPKNRKK